jgi:hypothetical protein
VYIKLSRVGGCLKPDFSLLFIAIYSSRIQTVKHLRAAIECGISFGISIFEMWGFFRIAVAAAVHTIVRIYTHTHTQE